MKVCLVGPDSVHIHRFYNGIKEYDIEFQMIAESNISWFDGKQFNFSFRSNNLIKLWRNYKNIRRILRKEKPQIVHIHQINRLAIIIGRAARKEGIKIIETAWGSDVLIVPKRNQYYASLTKSALKNADIITADAKVMIDSMKKLHPEGNYLLWQYGIDPILIEIPKENIIYSNRMHEPLYRIDKIIDYFVDFHKKNPDWKLIIAADGSLSQILRKQVENLELNQSVEFVGYCDAKENATFYSKSKIYISIPESDGTSVSLMEAMSAACIPVVSDIKVNHEWIKHQQNGIIENETDNPLFLAQKIDVEKAIIINKKLTESISRNRMLEEMFAIYKSLF